MENNLDKIAKKYETTSKIHALTKVDRTQIEFIWRIENFSFCSKKYEILESSTFCSNKVDDFLRWHIRLYLNGVNDENKNFIGVFLVLTQDKSFNKKKPKIVIYSFCIINSSEHKVNLVRCIPDGREFFESDSWGFPKFLNKDLLESDYNNLIPKDQLTIVLEMCIFGDIFTLDKLDLRNDNLKFKNDDNLEEKNLIKSTDYLKKYLNSKQNDVNLEEKKNFDLEKKIKNGVNKKEILLENKELILENKKENLIKKKDLEKRNKLKLEKKNFSDYFLNLKFSDLILISSDGKEIPVHKILLANESKVFCHKFENLKSENLKFEIKNFDYQTIIDVLSYIYKGNLIFESSLEKILSFVDFYCFLDLKLWCEKEMINKLSIDNAFNFLISSEKFNLVNLKNEALSFLKNNIENVSKTKEWKKIIEIYPDLVLELNKKILKNQKN